MKIDKILLTGERGAGKSTLLKKIWNFIIETFPSIGVTGFLTKKNEGNILMLTVIDTGESIILARSNSKGMSVEPEAFEKAADLLEIIRPEKKILIIDELGYLESNSIKFQEKVLHLISLSGFSLLVVRKMKTPFLDTIRFLSNSILIEVTGENRDILAEEIKDYIKQCYQSQ